MKFMVIVKASKDSESGVMPSPEAMESMIKFNEEMARAGILLAAEGLHPSKTGARVRFDKNDTRTVTDGPFTETKELVAGFWILQVKNRDEAIAWIKRAPHPNPGLETEVEIRQVYDFEDFGNELSPDIVEQIKRVESVAAEKNAPKK